MKLYELVIYQIYSQYHILFSSLLGLISLGQTVLLKQKYTKNRSLEFIKAIKNFCLLFYIQYSFSIQHSSIDSKTTELFRMIQEIYISLHSSLQILTFNNFFVYYFNSCNRNNLKLKMYSLISMRLIYYFDT